MMPKDKGRAILADAELLLERKKLEGLDFTRVQTEISETIDQSGVSVVLNDGTMVVIHIYRKRSP